MIRENTSYFIGHPLSKDLYTICTWGLSPRLGPHHLHPALTSAKSCGNAFPQQKRCENAVPTRYPPTYSPALKGNLFSKCFL